MGRDVKGKDYNLVSIVIYFELIIRAQLKEPAVLLFLEMQLH
jgi:hypothetical protein